MSLACWMSVNMGRGEKGGGGLLVDSVIILTKNGQI